MVALCRARGGGAERVMKPAALRPGATLAVVSPASAAKAELVQAGIDALHALGYRTKLMRACAGSRAALLCGDGGGAAGDLHGGVCRSGD